jgi:hypothetical protein
MNNTLRSSLILIVLLAACKSNGEPCDTGQRYSYGLCYEIDAAIVADAGPDASFAHFGDVCADTPACGVPTDYCARQPGTAAGYCTRTGCLTMPEACPAGWGCLDLSIFQAGLPAICSKP